MANMIPIQTVVIGAGGASSIDFINIPQNYTDLKLVFSIRTTATDTWDEFQITFNSNTANYSQRVLYGTGAAAGSASSSVRFYQIVDGDTATINTFGNGEIYIPNYTGSNNKSFSSDTLNENNATAAYIYMSAGLWSNTSPINSIKLESKNGAYSIKQHSSATLYGIRKY